MRNPGAKGEGLYNYGRSRNDRFDALAAQSSVEPDAKKREALIRTRDEVLVIPLHHQVRPWAMKQGVTTVHRSDDRPEVRFTTVK